MTFDYIPASFRGILESTCSSIRPSIFLESATSPERMN